MAMLAGAILESSGVRPLNAAASALPSERTIRFYVSRGLVTPPSGRGTAAVYTYRHILQVLHIKLRQMEGFTLETIAQELSEMTGDVLERRVASALGPGLPAPDQLPLTSGDRPAWGRAGRALRSWLTESIPEEMNEDGEPRQRHGVVCLCLEESSCTCTRTTRWPRWETGMWIWPMPSDWRLLE